MAHAAEKAAVAQHTAAAARAAQRHSDATGAKQQRHSARAAHVAASSDLQHAQHSAEQAARTVHAAAAKGQESNTRITACIADITKELQNIQEEVDAASQEAEGTGEENGVLRPLWCWYFGGIRSMTAGSRLRSLAVPACASLREHWWCELRYVLQPVFGFREKAKDFSVILWPLSRPDPVVVPAAGLLVV